jgi:hypothetical protein
MRISKISLTLAVVVLLAATSMPLSFAEDGASKISRLRADAIRTCRTAAAKFPDYSWGNMEMFIYRACMTEHRERE